MQDGKCRHCGSLDVRGKNLEIRHVNLNNMQPRSREMVRELECLSCGFVVSVPYRQTAAV